MNEKFLYFRTQATLADDQDANQSVCFPLSSFMGVRPGDDAANPADDDDKMVMYFKSLKNFDGAVSASERINNDFIEVDFLADNGAKEAIEDIINTFASSRKGMLTIVDEVTGEKCSPLLESLGAITVAAAIT